MTSKKKALVLFSGGQDSTTCLFWAKQNFDEVLAVNIHYGQRHAVEVDAAKKIAELAGVSLIEIQTDVFKSIGDSAMFHPEQDISQAHRSSENLPASFVPGRNLLFLTIAAALAYKHDITDIVTGVCQTDYSGYPDCRDHTIKALTVSLGLGMDRPFNIHTPLMFLSKKESVELAYSLAGCWEALAWSHTCYNGKVPPCGECPSCVLRQKGFKEAGVTDPLIIRTRS